MANIQQAQYCEIHSSPASKPREPAKSSKGVSEVLESEDSSVVDDEILRELLPTPLPKTLATIRTKKTPFYESWKPSGEVRDQEAPVDMQIYRKLRHVSLLFILVLE